jgi:hypothetical protein
MHSKNNCIAVGSRETSFYWESGSGCVPALCEQKIKHGAEHLSTGAVHHEKKEKLAIFIFYISIRFI